MSLLVSLPVIASLAAAIPPQDFSPPQLSMPGRAQHHLSLSMGTMTLDSPVVGDSDLFNSDSYRRGTQSAYGLTYYRGEPGAIGWEAGMILGNGSSSNNIQLATGPITGTQSIPGTTDSESTELFVGARYEADTGSIRPYLGMGLSFIDFEESYSYSDPSAPGGSGLDLGMGSGSGSGSTMGYYLHAGANLILDGNLSLGLDYRMVMGTEDTMSYEGGPFAGDGISMDSSMLSLVLGFGF